MIKSYKKKHPKEEYVYGTYGINDGEYLSGTIALMERVHSILITLSDMKNELTINHHNIIKEETSIQHTILKWDFLDMIVTNMLNDIVNVEFRRDIKNISINESYITLFQLISEIEPELQVTVLKLFNAVRKNNKKHIKISYLKDLVYKMEQISKFEHDSIITIDNVFYNDFNMLLFILKNMQFIIHQFVHKLSYYKPTDKYLKSYLLFFREDLITYLYYITLLFEKYLQIINEKDGLYESIDEKKSAAFR